MAAIVRVNDPARSRALWRLVLGMVSQGSGTSTMEPETLEIAGERAERYELDGFGVYLVSTGDEMIVSPSVSAIAHTLEARRGGRSVLNDGTFAPTLAALKDTSTFALLCSPARVALMGATHMSERERREILPVANLLDSTMISLRVEHSNTRIGVRAAIEGVPDVSRMLAGIVDAQRDRVAGHACQSSGTMLASDH